MNVGIPVLIDVIRQAVAERFEAAHVSFPAVVLDYDAATQTATVQPLVKRGYVDPESGDRAVEDLPAVTHVPTVFASGGGARLTFPVAAGDTCVVWVASCSLDRWLAVGGSVDPGDDRRNNLADAVALVGLRPRSASLQSAPTDRVTLGYDAHPEITVRPSEVRLGSDGAASYVALLSSLQKLLDVMGTVTDTAGACAALHTALVAAGWPAGFVATKVKAE